MPRHLTSFATPEFPLHPSGAKDVVLCPWRKAMEHMFSGDGDGDAGPAADTGSAVHAAAAALHRGKPIADCIQAMGEGLPRYPQADLRDAAAMFLSYSRDERNKAGEFLLVETTLQFSIAPHETDPTGAPVAVMMTVDHVQRDEHGRLRVRDIKTTKKDVQEMAHDYMYQQVLYCVGVSVHLKERVYGAQLVFPRRYTADPSTSPVTWDYAWGFDDLEDLVEPIRRGVADIRAGRLRHFPSPSCRWCPMRTPDVCFPALREHRKKNRELPLAHIPGITGGHSDGRGEEAEPAEQAEAAVGGS